MKEYSFLKWSCLKESADAFTSLDQKQGDIVYFGVHDLSKKYKQDGKLPEINLNDISGKKGEIIDADPIDQVVKVSVSKAPFHYGYRKLENEKDKMKRFMNADGQMEVKISVDNLKDISHLVNSDGPKIWLVIDGNTTYQKNLMREIRRKEMEKSNNEPTSPATRHYDNDDDLSIEEPEVDYMHVAHFNPTITGKGYGMKYFNENKHYKSYPV
jgi:hypothetical protein